MPYESFKELEKIDNVESIGSATNLNPLHDESVTIFLKNGYRIISTKSTFGQSLEVENINDSKLPSYKAEVYHQFRNNLPTQENKFYQQEESGSFPISSDDLSSKVATIIGEEVYDYLIARQESVPILIVPALNRPVPRKSTL